jgi:hypothetical protein
MQEIRGQTRTQQGGDDPHYSEYHVLTNLTRKFSVI